MPPIVYIITNGAFAKFLSTSEVEETVVELIVEALEAREIFRQRPQQDTRVSLGPVFNHFGLLGS